MTSSDERRPSTPAPPQAPSPVEAHARLGAALLEGPFAVALLRGPSHVVEVANARARDAFGLGEDAVGKPLTEAAPALAGAALVGDLDRALRTGEAQRARTARFEYVATAFRANEGDREGGAVDGVLLVALDTEAGALALDDRFLGTLGHDLRNPLNTILLTARVLLIRPDVPAPARDRLGKLVASGLRMQRMIEQLLDLTRTRLGGGIRLHRGEGPTDLAALVTKAVDEARAAAPERSIDLHVEGPVLAQADEARIEHVMTTLIGNAVTHGDPAAPVRVDLFVAHDAREVCLRVHNLGAIETSVLPLLWNPFARTGRGRGTSAGLGLGLYVSERILHAHGGTLAVRSSADEGTTFEARLPSAPPELGAATTAVQPSTG